MKANLRGVNLKVDLNNENQEELQQEDNQLQDNKEINLETGENNVANDQMNLSIILKKNDAIAFEKKDRLPRTPPRGDKSF